MRLLQREISGLHEAAFLLGVFAFLAKVIALVRDRFLTNLFGAGAELDVYYAAFRIPDFIYASIASLVASAVLIPFIVKSMERGGDVRGFFNSVFTVFVGAIMAVTAVVWAFMPVLSPLSAPGFDAAAQAELVALGRIILLSPLLLGLSGLFAGVTQSLRQFFVYAIGPILYNLGIMFGAVALYPAFGLAGLGYGVLVGAFLHMAVQLPVLARHGLLPRFTRRIDWQEIKYVLVFSLPRTAGLFMSQWTLLILTALASYMAEGSIAVFNLAFNLQSVPLSIIGISYSTAVFPTLARSFADGERAAFGAQIAVAMRHIIFWSLPVVMLFIVLRAQIVRTILGAGNFSWDDTRLTAAALALFIVSVICQSLILLFVRAYYAAGKTLKPLLINIISSVAIIIFAFVFTYLFRSEPSLRYFFEALLRVDDLPGTELLALPLAYSLGTVLNAWVLWVFLKESVGSATERIARTVGESFAASVIMGAVAYEGLQFFEKFFNLATLPGIFLQGLCAGLVGVASGIVILKAMRNKELEEVARLVHRKFWKRHPVAPDQGGL